MKYLKLYEDFSDEWDDEPEEDDTDVETCFNYNDDEKTLGVDIKSLKAYFEEKGINIVYSIFDMTDYDYGIHCEYELKISIEFNNIVNYLPQKQSLIDDFRRLPFVEITDGNKYFFIVKFKEGIFVEEN